MQMNLKVVATQVWGYLTLILGCLLSLLQFFALVFPYRLNLPVFILGVVLAASLIWIGIRSIRSARRNEVRGAKLADDLRTLASQCRIAFSELRNRLARPGRARTAFQVVFGLIHVIAGLSAFLFVGTVILAAGHYLGVGPAALPVLLFCLLGAVFGIVMIVRPSGGAHRAAAVWDMVLGGFFLLSTFAGMGFYMGRFVLAAIFLGLSGVLMIPDSAKKLPQSAGDR